MRRMERTVQKERGPSGRSACGFPDQQIIHQSVLATASISTVSLNPEDATAPDLMGRLDSGAFPTWRRERPRWFARRAAGHRSHRSYATARADSESSKTAHRGGTQPGDAR